MQTRNIYTHTREEREERLVSLIIQMKRKLAKLKGALPAGPFQIFGYRNCETI